MSALFEELDYCSTPLGELVLQRRRVLALENRDAYEVKLNGEYLMSSLFHEAEEALARLALGALNGRDWDVVVGGLGLGYTAVAALAFEALRQLVVIEALEPVIDWHRRQRVPNGSALNGDPRCELQQGDFFALARAKGFDPLRPGRRWDAVLLDIDHTPTHHLNDSHADFYNPEGLQRLKELLKPGGVFALWSDDPPDPPFLERLTLVFGQAEGHLATFENPLTDGVSANGIYLARNLIDGI